MGLINASIRMVPTASKKLLTTAPGRFEASDVRTEERPLMPVYPEMEDGGWEL
jgi:hypothetical protein